MRDTVISFSGGKDSVAMLIHAIEVLGRDNFRVVYQDTGYEHSTHYDYVNYIADKLNVDIEIIKSDEYKGMVDLIKKKNALPNAMNRFCTAALKQKPFKEWLRNNLDITSVWIGIRAEESKARKDRYSDYGGDKGFPISTYPIFGKKEFSHVFAYVPILLLTEKEVWDKHKKHNIKPNPQYTAGAKRVGCFPCILGSNRHWQLVWDDKEGRENILKLDELEKSVQKSRGKSAGGHIMTLRRDETISDFIKKMELADSQCELFDDKEVLTCGWCKG